MSDDSPRPPAGLRPVTAVEERLWWLHQLTPALPLYNVPVVVEITGPLAASALVRALRRIARRHEALRTLFPEQGGRPAAQALPDLDPDCAILDLRGLAGAGTGGTAAAATPRREPLAWRAVAAAVRKPFALDRGPLFRILLVRLEERRHLLAITFHHIVFDGGSAPVLAGELSALYRAELAGAAPPGPPGPPAASAGAIPGAIPGAAPRPRRGRQPDAAWLAGAFRARLPGGIPILDLPADHLRPAALSGQGATHPVILNPGLVSRLRQAASRHRMTCFMTVLAGFQLFLHRYSGQDDVLVGSPEAGRDAASANLIGCFVNTLLLHGGAAGDPTLPSFLARVKDGFLLAYTGRAVAFQRLAAELLPAARDPGRSPLFQASFTFQDSATAALAALRLDGVDVRHLPTGTGTAKFDLELALRAADDGGLRGEIEYSTDLFAPATAARMAEHLANLLAAVADGYGRRISELPMLGEEERRQIVLGWNATATATVWAATVVQQFEQQARRTPQAAAVEAAGQRMTYGELDRRASRVARLLAGKGVGPEVVVGLCVERSFELVVGLLAILKAGGAYLPLDPALPAERLAFMTHDARAALVLVASGREIGFATGGAEILELAAAAAAGTSPAAERFLAPESLAYVLYTSGSTGRPKGVMGTHGGLRNRLEWMQAAYRLSTDDRVLQKTPIGFDVSLWELLWPLAVGAVLVMAPPGIHGEPAPLAELAARERITVLHFVPSVLEAVLRASSLGRCGALRLVVASGEALTAGLAQRLLRQTAARLVNLYGPTEASIDVTAWECEPAGDGAADVPIGRPIANTRIHLLDRFLEPVPAGVPAELFIGGAGLARGYAGLPDLTAASFVPDPRGGEAGARLYRSGDRARYRPDGAIRFLGRLDGQVKVRGVRVEPGEVESCLLRIPGIQEAAVVARRDAGAIQLVAYLVADRSASPAPSSFELRRRLRESLPEPMLPQAYEFLEALPLTASGKLDRLRLPPPAGGAAGAVPAGPVEEALAELFAEVLERDAVDAGADFFALGGHSLLATQVLSRLRGRYQVEVSPRELLEAPSAAALSAKLRADPPRYAHLEKRVTAFRRVAALSDEEVERLLAQAATGDAASPKTSSSEGNPQGTTGA